MTEESLSAARAPIVFPPELPISARVTDLRAAIEAHQVVIVVGATGSGKTTQLPKVMLDLGRGTDGRIGVTQPRRIAATSVAARVAKELGCELGNEIGYKIRFEERIRPATYVKFMTDGILLAEIHSDRLLRAYDTLILDEAHERSLTIDFLLGWVKHILPERPDLKVVVSSATIESQRFSDFFGGAPVIEVEGRTFPVELLYEPPSDEVDLAEAVANAVGSVTALDPRGDILVFLPGEREIRECEQELAAKNLRHTRVQPLYGRLSGAEQARVFSSISERRVILATNVAETSLTIPGIVYVIDAGLARLSRYDPRSGTTRLQIEPISQASANQRMGRCGRVREGMCVRLYDEESFDARPPFTDPEILRTGLSGVILRMKALELGAVESFAFLDPPSSRAIAEGYRVLEELNALDAERELTPLGRKLARFPVDPRIGRMILAGAEQGCLPEVLVVAAALNVQDPRERPRGLEQQADQQQRRFRDERSDFVGLLRMWEFVRDAESRGKAALRRACKESFLSFMRVREWSEVHRQLRELAAELNVPARAPRGAVKVDDGLHLALLSGLLSKVGKWNPEQRVYVGAKQTRFVLHPSSALAKRPPEWVMAFELVQTTQLFARTAARIEPGWLERVGEHLLKRSFADPRWSEKSARTSIQESATLFGLPVFRGRGVDYASVSPEDARRLFIEHALVRGEYRSRGAFQKKNRALLDEVARLRDKARKSDMLADDEALFAFFDRRVDGAVVNGKTFESWRERAEQSEPELLCLSIEDVLTGEQALSASAYPDSVTLHGVTLALSYRFDPSAEDDGISMNLPLALLPQLEASELSWTVPGWLTHRITVLLRDLPRSLLRELGSVPELAAALAERLRPFSGPFAEALCEGIFALRSVRVPESAIRLDALPPYLNLTYRILDERGQSLGESRDFDELKRRHLARALDGWGEAEAVPAFQRTGITSWDFGELPEFVPRQVAGVRVRAYPALLDRGTSVELTLLPSRAAAELAMQAGIRRLLLLAARRPLSALVSRVPAPFARNALPPPRAEVEAFREQFLARVAEEAFALDSPLPRTEAMFERLLSSGTPRLPPTFQLLSTGIEAVRAELTRTRRTLEQASRQPAGRAAVEEVRAQIEQLLPGDFLKHVPLARLQQFPRYLRAAEIRLTRALNDPRRDAEKAAPFTPLWQAFLAKWPRLRDQASALAVRWAFEELRVAIFAPELKTPAPINVASLGQTLDTLE